MATSESRVERYARLRRALPADQAQWGPVSRDDLGTMLRYNGVPWVSTTWIARRGRRRWRG